jgi:hypothetical protein
MPLDLFNESKTMLNLKGGTLSVDDSVLDKQVSYPVSVWTGAFPTRKH